MDIALLLANKITQLTLIVLLGYALVKFNLLKSEESYPLSIIGLYIISPATLITAFQIDYSPEIIKGLALSFVMAILLSGLLILIGKIITPIFKLDNLEHAASIYSNSGNLIIPIVASLFGAEWVIYSTGFIVIQNLLFWSHLRILLCGKANVSLKNIIFNINILAIILGIFLFAFQIKLPSVISGTLSSLAVMIGPMAMFVAGMLIAAMPIKQIMTDKRIYLVAFLRLILIPLILLFIIKWLDFPHWIEKNGEIIAMISFLATTSPSAATVTQMAVVYGQNAQKASAIYGVTTLLCVITMPLVIALYQMI
ncbi:AEC family transporter [Actinobacillus minor]|uniref:AEC family transporter n=1 Tax=Actinobacillus minor TaxID=51047 RepID=UPI0023F16006|nr:AEC family transporter [Actinobacillus minor]MDD6910312.1 AEC family transporter [Actinobacillus minor]MDY4714019.1 AEC family transporter [Actinobacillus minor]